MRKVITAVCILLVLGTTVDAEAHRARRHRHHKRDANTQFIRMKHKNVNVIETDIGQQTFGIPVVIERGTPGTEAAVDYSITAVDATRADYNTGPGRRTVTFAGGQHEANIPVIIRGDLLDEGNEVLRIELFNPRCTGAGPCDISGARNPEPGFVTIIDDEGAKFVPNIKVSDDLIDGDETRCDIEVSLSRGSEDTVTVDYETNDGTATAGDDYVLESGKVTFSPGQVTKEVEIVLKSDRDGEARDLFTVAFSNAVNGNLTDDTANCRFDDAGTGVDVDDD